MILQQARQPVVVNLHFQFFIEAVSHLLVETLGRQSEMLGVFAHEPQFMGASRYQSRR
jgi:hypothetical protein